MGAAINRFNGGLDQDTNIQDYSNQKYVDAMNMQILSDNDFINGSIEAEKGMVASLTFPATTVAVYDVTVEGTWSGTIEIGSQYPLITVPADTPTSEIAANFTVSYNPPPPVPITYESSHFIPGYSYSVTDDYLFMQYRNRIVIVSYNGSAITVTPSVGTGTITQTAYYSTRTNLRILGYTNLRDDTIVFTTANANNSLTPTNYVGQIWKVHFNTNGTVTSTNVKLIYEGVLNFSTRYPVEARSHFINEKFGKVYFTDSYNNLRHCNVYDYTLLGRSPEELEVLPTTEFDKPIIEDLFNGGSYKSGIVQYAYQMYNKYGAETVVSPASVMIPLADSISYSGSDEFIGSPPDEEVRKSVKVSISSLDDRFDYIRVFAIYYSSVTSNPEIRIIVDQKIENSKEKLSITDDGFINLGSITLQEFRFYNRELFSAKTIELQNNRLIAANLKKRYFDVDYDARAYRHDSSGYFSIDQGSVVAGNSTNWGNVPEYANCVPTYTGNDKTNYYDTYRYQNDGSTVGGKGINISYKFNTIDLPLDNKKTFQHMGSSKTVQEWSSTLDTSFVDNSSYGNYASPINASQLVGYKRGETYRFGIVFRDSRGRVSPVKWIGDIKIPEHNDLTIRSIGATTTTEGANSEWLSEPMPIEKDYGMFSAEYPYSFKLDMTGKTLKMHMSFKGVTRPFRTIYDSDGDGYIPLDDDIASFFTQVEKYLQGTELSIIDNSYVIDESNPSAPTIQFKFTLRGTDYSTFSAYFTIEEAGQPTYTYDLELENDNTGETNIPGTDTNVAFYSKDSVTTANVIYPEFTVSNVPVDDTGAYCSYEIVRVERQDKDKTRIAQGLILPVVDSNINEKYPIVDIYKQTPERKIHSKSNDGTAKYLYDNGSPKDIINFISPEVNFRKVNISKGDKISVFASIPSTSASYTVYEGTYIFKLRSINHLTTPLKQTIGYTGIIKADADITADLKENYVKDFRITNVLMDGEKQMALAGTSSYIVTDSPLVTTNTYNNEILYGEIIRSVSNQYGGDTFQSRTHNEYISCGHFSAGHSGSKVNMVFGGDTFIAIFDYLRGMWVDKKYNGNETGNFQQVLYIPVETCINLDYRYDQCFHKRLITSPQTAKYLQEYAGDYSGKVGTNDDAEINYFQEYDLYLENQVYSKPNNINKYLAQPIEEDGEETDCIIQSSEEFTYDSVTDDLIRFLYSNHRIVHTEHGPINKLVSFKDNMFFFQDRAIGMVPISERSLVQDTKGIELVLGTGDVLGPCQYVTTSSGTKYRSSISIGERGIYYFDSKVRTLCRVTNHTEDVTILKGLNSYFKTNVPTALLNYDSLLQGSGLHTVYDPMLKRIIFTMIYLGGGNYFTVSYNELTDSFTSFHTYLPEIYLVDHNGNLHSEKLSSLGTFYVHNKGNYGQYYGTNADSYLTYLVSAEPTTNKKFTNVELDFRIGASSLQSSTDTQRLDHAISKIKFWTDYKATNDLNVVIYPTAATPGTSIQARQLMGIWRLAVPSVTESTVPTRLFDKHLFTKITYSNDGSNHRFVLNNAITYYQPAQL